MNQQNLLLQAQSADEQALKALLLDEAGRYGPSVTKIVENIWIRSVMNAVYEAQRFFKLSKSFPPNRLEAASHRALFHAHGDYATVEHILQKKFDQLPLSPYTDIDGQLLFWPTTSEKTL